MKCSVIPLFIRIKLVHLITNGEEIITTDNHPFYVQGRGFINAGNLLVGDKLISVNGEDLFVKKHYIEETDVPVDVYNFQVEDHHTYFVGESAVWVHNDMCQPQNVPDGMGQYKDKKVIIQWLKRLLKVQKDMIIPKL